MIALDPSRMMTYKVLHQKLPAIILPHTRSATIVENGIRIISSSHALSAVVTLATCVLDGQWNARAVHGHTCYPTWNCAHDPQSGGAHLQRHLE